MANEIIYSSTDTDLVPIAVATIAGIYKMEYIPPEGGTTVYRIIFVLSGGTKQYWKFTSSADRDTTYNGIIAQYGFDAY